MVLEKQALACPVLTVYRLSSCKATWKQLSECFRPWILREHWSGTKCPHSTASSKSCPPSHECTGTNLTTHQPHYTTIAATTQLGPQNVCFPNYECQIDKAGPELKFHPLIAVDLSPLLFQGRSWYFPVTKLKGLRLLFWTLIPRLSRVPMYCPGVQQVVVNGPPACCSYLRISVE